ncbi:HAAS domain-containing protein [Paenibacillus yanchengensis]|uniref:HAAS domain-containing protein n=1 Tax=Paenibacillus yanchengensis TaxID=2035833 RepID=A0ABW4YQB1_9BACL
MKNELQLSKKSQDFLENLRLYLFSSGKNTDEIDDIVRELETHLSEAEKNGKSIDKIIGKSPKEYMKMISNEMIIDYRTWFKYICIIVLGSFSFTVFPDLLKGNLSYSVLEIFGHILIGIVFIASVFTGFKYLSTVSQSISKQGMVLVGLAILPIALFVGLIFLNKAIDTPVIYFGNTASLIIGLIMFLFIIGVSIWAKTWTLIIIIALLTLPDYLLNLTSLQYETKFIVSMIITFGGIALYLWILSKLEMSK